jgi:hypothetical protein
MIYVDGRLFPEGIDIPVFMTIKNTLLGIKHYWSKDGKGPWNLGYMKKVFNPFSNGFSDGCIRILV